MIPLRDENPASLTPVVTRVLIAINVAVFLYELLLGPQLREFLFTWGMIPERITLALQNHDEPVLTAALTAFTSMFLHGGWMHLIGNMWYLAIFGDNVEDRLGHVGYLFFYFAAGLAAAAVHWYTNSDSRVPTVGASGAIAGVLGAYAAAYPGARVITLVPLFPIFVQVIALPALVVLGLWFVLQFFSGFLTIGAAGAGIAFWAHVGGFAFGFLVMKLFGAPRRPREPSEAWVEH
jgi:membrane associated rhomboid family serine protease